MIISLSIVSGIILVGAWIITSVMTYGWTLAYYQREYPMLAEQHYKKDVQHAWSMAWFPFAGFLTVLVQGTNRTKHGMMFKKEQRGQSPHTSNINGI